MNTTFLATFFLLAASYFPLVGGVPTPINSGFGLGGSPTALASALQADAPAKAGDELTADLLGAMLKGLGYETGTTAPGQFAIEIKQGTYTLHPIVSLSTSGKKIWITTSIRTMSADDNVNADLLLKLLKANNAIGPGQFYVENVAADGKPVDWRLGFGYPVDNRGVTADVLRGALDAFAGSLVDNASVWDTAPAKPKTGG